MALSIVAVAQTGTGNTNFINAGTPVGANWGIIIFSQSGSSNTPTVADTSGVIWTVIGTHTTYSTNSMWAAYSNQYPAPGGIGSVVPNVTAGTGGTINGVDYWEVAGFTTLTTSNIDVIGGGNSATAVTTITTGAITTTKSGDAIFMGAGTATTNSGIGTWNSPVTANAGTNSRCRGAYYVPGTIVSGQTYTANWANSVTAGTLVLALSPTGITPPTANSGFFMMM